MPRVRQSKMDVQLVTEEILKGLDKGPMGLWRPAVIDIAKREKATVL